MSNSTVILISKEGEEIEASINHLNESVLIKSMIDEDSSDEHSIPVPKVTSKVMKIIIEFLEYNSTHKLKNIPKPIPPNTKKLESIVKQKWYVEFMNRFEIEEIYELVHASNYLDIKPLLNLCCAYIAITLLGKNTSELRELFKISSPDSV